MRLSKTNNTTRKKKEDMPKHSCNSRTQQPEAGGSQLQSQPGLSQANKSFSRGAEVGRARSSSLQNPCIEGTAALAATPNLPPKVMGTHLPQGTLHAT